MSLRLSGGRIEDHYVNFFEMFEKGMKVVELQVATCVVTTLYILNMREVIWVEKEGAYEFAFSFENVYGIQERVVHWSFSGDAG